MSRPETITSLPNFVPSSFGSISNGMAELRDRPLCSTPSAQNTKSGNLGRPSASTWGHHATQTRPNGSQPPGHTQRLYFRSETPRQFADPLGPGSHPTAAAIRTAPDHTMPSSSSSSGLLQGFAEQSTRISLQYPSATGDGKVHELPHNEEGHSSSTRVGLPASSDGDRPQISSRKSLWASGSRRLGTDPERGHVRARAALFDTVCICACSWADIIAFVILHRLVHAVTCTFHVNSSCKANVCRTSPSPCEMVVARAHSVHRMQYK
jgi:hypothetical protein